MDMNYLVQRKRNTQKKYRRKVTITVALGVILVVLILIGLIKVIVDEKKAAEGNNTSGNLISGELTPAASGQTAENPATENREVQPDENKTEVMPEATATPTPTPTLTPTPTPVPKKKVAVDPGHGGENDLGSPRPNENRYEKDANLAIALYLKEELLNRGYDVYMIRETDEAVENRERPIMAKENGADIYVSIHLNSLDEDSDATRGAETWYHAASGDGSEMLAQCVVDELTKVVETRNRGIKTGKDLIVLKYNELPACLVECGFMSSATECAKLFDSEYQKKIAEGIANGIEKFLPVE